MMPVVGFHKGEGDRHTAGFFEEWLQEGVRRPQVSLRSAHKKV